MSDEKEVKDDDSDYNLKNLEWTDNLESLLAKWSDEALSYAWLHVKSESKFRKLNYAFTIPIVVLSTLTGSITLAMGNIVPPAYSNYGQLATGALSIFTGILGTLLNFFKYAQISESHRNVSVQWHKFYRNLKTELALDRNCRKVASVFYITAKNEMDRLLDSSPNIPGDIIQKYYDRNENVELPDIIGTLHRTRIYRGNSFIMDLEQLGGIDDLKQYQNTPMSMSSMTNTPKENVLNNHNNQNGWKENPVFINIKDKIKTDLTDVKNEMKDSLKQIKK